MLEDVQIDSLTINQAYTESTQLGGIHYKCLYSANQLLEHSDHKNMTDSEIKVLSTFGMFPCQGSIQISHVDVCLVLFSSIFIKQCDAASMFKGSLDQLTFEIPFLTSTGAGHFPRICR